MLPKIVVRHGAVKGSDVGGAAAGSSSVFVQLSATARFLPSLRDLVASTLVPGLKAWAIFGSPCGTLPNSEMRLKRQLRPSSTPRPSWEESSGPAHVITILLSEGLAHHLFFARRAKKIHERKSQQSVPTGEPVLQKKALRQTPDPD